MASAPSLMSGGGGGGTKKPFTYCPGGINFSELKSPRMARRIAKHQSQMDSTGDEANSQPNPQMPPPRKDLVGGGTTSSNTATLPSPAIKPRQVHQPLGRQRSISELLGCSDDPPPQPFTSTLPSPRTDHKIFSFNPYAPDRSISIPPPTPPPLVPNQTVDSLGQKATSVPPNEAFGRPPPPPPQPPVPHPQRGTNVSLKPGLPPPHPMGHAPEKPAAVNSTPPQPTSSFVPSTAGGKPPPPPPPMPPPSLLGIVAQSGPKGVPYIGKKPVRLTLNPADVLCNRNSAPQEQTEHKEYSPDISNSINKNDINAPDIQSHVESVKNQGLTFTSGESGNLNLNEEYGASLNEFEAQRSLMLSPHVTNVNSIPRPDLTDPISHSRKINSPQRMTSDAQGKQADNCSIVQNIYSSEPNINSNTQIPLSVMELNSTKAIENDHPTSNFYSNTGPKIGQNFPEPDFACRPSDDIKPKEINVPQQKSLQKEWEGHNSNISTSATESNNNGLKLFGGQRSVERDEPELMDLHQTRSVRYRPPSPRVVTPVRFTPTPKLARKQLADTVKSNDEHGPFGQSFSNIYPNNSYQPPNQPNPSSNYSNFGMLSSDLDNKLSTQYNNSSHNQTSDLGKKSSSESLRNDTSSLSNNSTSGLETKKMVPPTRNVSDSGISDSTTSPEPEDIAGKIITEQMQKIEAQMKKILEAESSGQTVENTSTANRQQCITPPSNVVRPSESTTSINSISLQPSVPESQRNSFASNGNEPGISNYSTLSGYSTCSEEELKFEEPKIEIPILTAPFEIMEEFEEAPEEFDLGISSYSIAHPHDSEEMERTPVPEYDSDNYSTLGKNQNSGDYGSCYRVTTPTQAEKLKQANAQANYQPNNKFLNQPSMPNFDTSNRIPRSAPIAPQFVNQFASPDLSHAHARNGMFPHVQPESSLFSSPFPSMFEELTPMQGMFNSQPSFPSTVYNSPFGVQHDDSFLFNSSFPSMPVTVPFNPSGQTGVPAAEIPVHKSDGKNSSSGERIIPIQIVKAQTADEKNVKTQQASTVQQGSSSRNSCSSSNIRSVPIKLDVQSAASNGLNKSSIDNRFDTNSSHKNATNYSNFSQPSNNTNYNSYSQPSNNINNNSSNAYGNSGQSGIHGAQHPATAVNQGYPQKTAVPSQRPAMAPPVAAAVPPPPAPPPPPPQPAEKRYSFPGGEPHRDQSAASPAPLASSSPSISRNPSASLLQNQLGQLRQTPRGEDESRGAFLQRQSSRDSIASGRSSTLGRETPVSFRQLQERYGSPTSPTEFLLIAGKTPLTDIDYQKTARQSVVGELSSFGGVSKASKIVGPRRRPSQSPSMRLLGMLHVHDDPEDPMTESVARCQEYGGERGRFMPPPNRGARAGQLQNPDYQRSISSQL